MYVSNIEWYKRNIPIFVEKPVATNNDNKNLQINKVQKNILM